MVKKHQICSVQISVCTIARWFLHLVARYINNGHTEKPLLSPCFSSNIYYSYIFIYKILMKYVQFNRQRAEVQNKNVH